MLGPEGHALDRGHEAAEEDEGEHDEEHEKHGLLHGVGEVGDDDAYAGHDDDEEQRRKEDGPYGTGHGETVDEESESHAEGELEEADDPEGDELGEGERKAAHGGDIDLLYGAQLLLGHEVEGGQESADHHHEHDHQGGYHEVLVVHGGVVVIDN